MNEFWLWFTTGLYHILDYHSYDHIIYIMALCAIFTIKDWKPLSILITAFTIGHSITLALSVSGVIAIKQSFIEILIPLTIFITCIINLFFKNKKQSNYRFNYILAIAFGFIHGMGFSYLLKSILGKEENILLPLFSFNLGIEVAQLTIVFATILISVIFIRFTKIKRPVWNSIVNAGALSISTFLLIQQLIQL